MYLTTGVGMILVLLGGLFLAVCASCVLIRSALIVPQEHKKTRLAIWLACVTCPSLIVITFDLTSASWCMSPYSGIVSDQEEVLVVTGEGEVYINFPWNFPEGEWVNYKEFALGAEFRFRPSDVYEVEVEFPSLNLSEVLELQNLVEEKTGKGGLYKGFYQILTTELTKATPDWSQVKEEIGAAKVVVTQIKQKEIKVTNTF